MIVVCSMSPVGFPVPPAIIFPRVRFHFPLYAGAPAGSLQLHSQRGYMNVALFVEWLKYFQSHVKALLDDSVFLVLDNYVSHRSMTGIDFSLKNNIHLISLPPHATHKIQPLDRGFFGPLKCEYAMYALILELEFILPIKFLLLGSRIF